MSRSEHTRFSGWTGFLVLSWVIVGALFLALRPSSTPPEDSTQTAQVVGTEEQAPSMPATVVSGELLLEIGPEAVAPADVCTAGLWWGTSRVATVECGEGGAFRFELDSRSVPASARLNLELERPGRLRGFIEVAIGQGTTTDVGRIALGEGFVVSGEVIDGQGRPVAGVVVDARPNPDLGEPLPWSRTTDGDGRFAFDTLPLGPITLRVADPRFAPSVVEAISPEDRVVIVVRPLEDLEGKVFATREVLDEAIVRIEGSSVWPPLELPMGESRDGSFIFEELPDGVYAIEVTAKGKASVPLENVTPDMRVDLALIDAYEVPVRVVDAEGEPVPAARVTLSYASVAMLKKSAETDEQGAARVGPVVPGPYVVRADADGYLPSRVEEVLVEGELAEPVQLVLQRAGALAGVVVDENGEPVPRAIVEIRTEVEFTAGEADARAALFARAAAPRAGAGSLGVTTGPVPDIPGLDEPDEVGDRGLLTDENGRFEVEGLFPGAYSLVAYHGGHASSAPVDVQLRSGEARDGLVLTLREGQRLTGRVRDTRDFPVEGARVSVDRSSFVFTDRQGLFDAGHFRGTVEITVRAQGLAPLRTSVTLRNRPKDVELTLLDADSSLEGRVRDGNDRPIDGVVVQLELDDRLSPMRFGETDSQGVFAFENLPAGGATLSLEHRDYSPLERAVRIRGATGPIELVMNEGWVVELMAVDADTGEAIGNARVKSGIITARMGRDGTVMLDGLPDIATLTVSAPGYASERRTVSRGETDDELVVELVPGGSVEGTVVDDLGQGLGGVVVEVRTRRGRALIGQDRTSRTGAYRVDDVAAGDVVIIARVPASLADILQDTEIQSDILEGLVTRDADVRFDRREGQN